MVSANRLLAEKKAEEVNRISLRYHLSHATVACDVLLQEEFKKKCEESIAKLNAQKEKAFQKGDVSEFAKLEAEQKRLSDRKHFHIFVEYLNMSDSGSARTVCIDNQLIIYLPKHLQTTSVDENMSYSADVRTLRALMAHELGHVILHTSELYDMENSTIGSATITETTKEQEAKWFADKLLELRHLRNTKLKQEGTLEKYF